MPKTRILEKTTEFIQESYIVVATKAPIYKTPDIHSKTTAYFIKGDIIEPIDIDGKWVYISYKDNTKFGWLSQDDLIKKSLYSTSPSQSIDTTSNYTLTENGFNDIYINQPYDSSLFEKDSNSSNPEILGCFYAKIEKYPYNLLELFFLNNSLATIGTQKSNFETYMGVKVGDTQQIVYDKHINQTPEIRKNDYTEGLTIIYWNDDGNIGTRYDIENDKVVKISIGDEQALNLMEGCS